MDSPAEVNHHSFIIRISVQPASAAPFRWRGWIEHVASRQKAYFTSLADMNDFMTFVLQDIDLPAGQFAQAAIDHDASIRNKNE